LNNKTVIEVDGKIHDYQKEHDKLRDDILTTLGYKVIRINNEEILNNLNTVLMKLKRELAPLPDPLQRRGK